MQLFFDEREAYETLCEISEDYLGQCYVQEWSDNPLIVAKSPTGKVYGIRVQNEDGWSWFHQLTPLTPNQYQQKLMESV